MTRPSVGRHVWYRGQPWGGARYDEQPMAAVVVYVYNERLVNLTVFDHEGQSHSVVSVPLKQPGDRDDQLLQHYCEWILHDQQTPRCEQQLSEEVADITT